MQKMPVVFIGHGSPMNAIETNTYTESWKKIGESLPRPKAIVVLSAHWITEGKTLISGVEHPEMIYDMYGFPEELYNLKYPTLGSPEIASEIRDILMEKTNLKIDIDPNRGIDHGVWSTLIHMFPSADIPVIPMSLDYRSSMDDLYRMGETMTELRERGLLIMGSGNIVHNLRAIDWSGKNIYPWAVEFDHRITQAILGGKTHHNDILTFQSWGDITRMAHPTHDHFLPLIPLLGATTIADQVSFYTPDIVMGSLAMRSIVWSE